VRRWTPQVLDFVPQCGGNNQRPQWLVDAHCDLDDAVSSAYGWPAYISETDALAKLLELNLSRVAISEQVHAPKTKSPEEIRRSPQFKLPISGGKPNKAQGDLLTGGTASIKTPAVSRRRSRRRRRQAY
jgi:hypothetical protein